MLVVDSCGCACWVQLDKDIGDSLNTPPPTAMALMQSQAVIVAEDEVEVDDVKYKFALARSVDPTLANRIDGLSE